MTRGLGHSGSEAEPDHGFPIVIATVPASARQHRAALAVIVVLVMATVAAAPFADRQLPRIEAFLPVVQTVLAVGDLITAVLLFAQYSILPQRAMLAVASAYLFSASFAFLQTLSFPGAYAPSGLFGDGSNTPAWFFVLWHVTFSTAILAYTLSKEDAPDLPQPSKSGISAIVLTIIGVLAVVAATSWVVTTKVGSLPEFYSASVTLQTNLGNQANVGLLILYSLVLLVLFVRKRTVLDLWLLVVLAAWTPNFLIAALASSVRFSLGWYVARCFALVASFMLLSVLLTEMTVLYSRLANAFSLLRRERANRLLSVDAATAAIAHEVRTPLASITANAGAGLIQLRNRPPALRDVEEILRDIEADGQRAGEIIASVRGLFNPRMEMRAPTELGEVARRVLRLSEPDLLANSVSVTTDFADRYAEVLVEETQLQQVVLNLVRNAVDAMKTLPPANRRLRLASRVESDVVSLSVQDTGLGISAADHDRIFDPFFTTKTSGMGLGLAICRTIVEGHSGTLRMVASGRAGSRFEITLPRTK